MKKFLLYGHGGSYNHGAEASVKTTIAKIRAEFPDAYIGLSTHFPEQDREFDIDADVLFAPNPEIWEREKKAPVEERKALACDMYADALSFITPDTVLYSVGGDNFCYPNWHRLAVFQDEAVKQGARSILWSASVEPVSITPAMLKVLNTYNLIIVRESVTYNALKERKVRGELKLVRDAAFDLQPVAVSFPAEFRSGNYVAVNVSPLAVRREKTPGIVMDNFRNLVIHILTKSSANVAFVPHVVMPVDNDCDALSELLHTLPEELRSRVWFVDGKFSAAQLKYVIAHSQNLVCCRTHASIAAYSTNVPCLVVGYSVKAIGIAEDLGVSRYVIPVSDLTLPEILLQKWLTLPRHQATVDTPLISIVMSVRNGEDTIKETIESVIAQTYKNWELIIGDNCSTDETVSIIESFTDPRIRLIKNEYDKGAIYNQRLLGEHAHGEYLKPLDDDSYLYPENLEKELNAFLTNENIALVTCDTEYRTPNGKTISARIPFKKDIVSREEYIKYTLKNARGSVQEGNQCLYRTAIFKHIWDRYFSIGLAAGLVNMYSGYFYFPSYELTKGNMYIIRETLSAGRMEANSYSLKYNQAKLQGVWIKLLQLDGYKIPLLLYIWAHIMIFVRSTARRLVFGFLGR
jgi:glycosyltransferase involved in cell wall biosynthesis